jgi:hypothetical protein
VNLIGNLPRALDEEMQIIQLVTVVRLATNGNSFVLKIVAQTQIRKCMSLAFLLFTRRSGRLKTFTFKAGQGVTKGSFETSGTVEC